MEKPEELTLVTDLLDKLKLVHSVVNLPYQSSMQSACRDHYTVFMPSKNHYTHLISFDIPFDGYRCARAGEYDSRFDTYTDGLEDFARRIVVEQKKAQPRRKKKK